MRFVAFFLVFANLFYFAWYQMFPRQKPADIVPLSGLPGTEELVLLSEMAVPEPVAKSALARAADAAKQGTQISKPLTSTSVPRKAIEEHKPQRQNALSSTPQSQDSGPYPASGSVTPGHVCTKVGPLFDSEEARVISKNLSRHGFQVNVHDGKMREPAGYWVYMPAMPANEAKNIVADLDARGMKDYFIGRRNHISLGIFSTEGKARKRQQRVKQLGYDAQLGQRYRNRAVYWLNIEERGSKLSDSPIWKDIRVQNLDIRSESVSCADLGR